MCPSSKRADALQAMTLVETVAALATLGFFGFVFSAFTEAGKAYLTFYCNAVSLALRPWTVSYEGHADRLVQAVAVLAVGVLCLSSFPPAGSEVVEDSDVAVDDTEEANVGT